MRCGSLSKAGWLALDCVLFSYVHEIKRYFSEMSACRGALAHKTHKPIHRWWTEFIFVDLTIACIAGFVYAVLIMGMRPLHPSDVSWLPHHGATAHIGWELFR